MRHTVLARFAEQLSLHFFGIITLDPKTLDINEGPQYTRIKVAAYTETKDSFRIEADLKNDPLTDGPEVTLLVIHGEKVYYPKPGSQREPFLKWWRKHFPTLAAQYKSFLNETGLEE